MINYARKQWGSLTLYLNDGRVEIDNNAAERAIRPLALGQKNHLFAGSEDGGHYGAALYSILGTGKLNGIDPKTYLTAVLKRINNTKTSDVESLLPWNINLDDSRRTGMLHRARSEGSPPVTPRKTTMNLRLNRQLSTVKYCITYGQYLVVLSLAWTSSRYSEFIIYALATRNLQSRSFISYHYLLSSLS